MLRIDSDKKTLITLERKTMREAGYWERRDIQENDMPDARCLLRGTRRKNPHSR
jgi:hypothetical protein